MLTLDALWGISILGLPSPFPPELWRTALRIFMNAVSNDKLAPQFAWPMIEFPGVTLRYDVMLKHYSAERNSYSDACSHAASHRALRRLIICGVCGRSARKVHEGFENLIAPIFDELEICFDGGFVQKVNIRKEGDRGISVSWKECFAT